tara:strand:+ start:1117 stop:1650 length:534 start_codon:yes stop_codon:yes gene_type:complete
MKKTMAEQQIHYILTKLKNIRKESVTTRRKTGTFDKDLMLNRATNLIYKAYRLKTTKRTKNFVMSNAWKIYMDVQSMSSTDSIYDENMIPLAQIVAHVEGKSEEGAIDSPIAPLYSNGLGYSHVSWKHFWADPNFRTGIHADQWFRTKWPKWYNIMRNLEDTDYWVFNTVWKSHLKS